MKSALLSTPDIHDATALPDQPEAELLRRHEPILRFTRGEQFFPLHPARYVHAASLWEQRAGEDAVSLIEGDDLSLDALGSASSQRPDAVQFLKFTEPLPPGELASFLMERSSARQDPIHVFRPGRGRLARVGYVSRFIDALFTISLLARGRVPGDTAAAAALAYREMMAKHPAYHYCGRVVRDGGWTILQYWYFYVYNNWRSSFFGANDHEADWEMVCIYLSDAPQEDGERDLSLDAEPELIPQWIAYASHDAHGDDLRRRWDDPEVEKIGGHPVVYVGAGSHACYYRPGDYLTELELPFLTPLIKLTDRLQAFWHRQLRQYRGEESGDNGENGNDEVSNIFRIPFVDYARGDGIAIGPGQAMTWQDPVVIDETTPWVSQYRGLWGLYTSDPFAGEDAPAGPMYNRDRSVRRAWYDPLGWAGLDKVAPPDEQLAVILDLQMELRRRQEELEQQIDAKSRELRAAGAAVDATRTHPHLRRIENQTRRRLADLSRELNDLRAEAVDDKALTEALEGQARQVRAGYRGPMRAHIRRARAPTPDEQYRAVRLAEIWAATSTGLALVGFVMFYFFTRRYLTLELTLMIALFTFIEATFRGRVVRLVTSVTIGLAVVSALILIYEFFWPLMAVLVFLIGVYILWDNLNELRK